MADGSDASRASSRDLFMGFDLAPLPDAIDAFRFRVRESDDPTGLERYALRLFDEIDMDRLRSLAGSTEIVVARIARMGAYYLNFDHNAVGEDDRLLLYQVEAILNRLSRLMDHLGDALPSEEDCSALDLRNFQDVVAFTRDVLEEAGSANPLASPGTVRCALGGEWDLRTRLAARCESFSPITRLEYGFDCDVAAGEVALRFTAPTGLEMPGSVYEDEAAAWRDLDAEEREALAQEHAARIAIVLAAAAFSAGMKVARCSVTVWPARVSGKDVGDADGVDASADGRECEDKAEAEVEAEAENRRPASGERTYVFERPAFFAVCVPLTERLADAPLFDQVALRALKPVLGQSLALGVADGIDPRRRPVAEDDRPLPPALRDLLMADTARDLNIMEPADSPSMQRFRKLQAEPPADPRELERLLADLAGELEGACAAQELTADAPTISQFCENGLCRALIPLLADDRSVRINRAPDALFFAQHELAVLYARQQRYDLALEEARRVLDIAGTSIQAHFALINILARMERFDDLIEVCRHGLSVAYDRRSAAYYFYRMAFAYWSRGDRELALACYALVPNGEQVTHVAHMEMRALMVEMGVTEAPSVQEAAAAAGAAGISLAPSAAVSDQIADAAVMLTDGGFFMLARACVSYLWQVMGSDELGAVVRSLAG